jgi:hypothetical protein
MRVIPASFQQVFLLWKLAFKIAASANWLFSGTVHEYSLYYVNEIVAW